MRRGRSLLCASSAAAATVQQSRGELIVTRHLPGELDLDKDASLQTLLASERKNAQFQPFGFERCLTHAVRTHHSIVLRDKETEEALAMGTYSQTKAPLLGRNALNSQAARWLLRHDVIALDPDLKVELLRFPLEQYTEQNPAVEVGYAHPHELGMYEFAGYLVGHGCVPIVSSARPPLIHPINEPRREVVEVKDRAGLKRLRKMFEYASESTRFPSVDRQPHAAYVIKNDKGDWLAGCEVIPRRVNLGRLFPALRMSVMVSGLRGLRALFTGKFSNLHAAQIGAVTHVADVREMSNLFRGINARLRTDLAIHISPDSAPLSQQWQQHERPFEYMGFVGHQLSRGLQHNMPYVLHRTFHLNPVHDTSFAVHPIDIPPYAVAD